MAPELALRTPRLVLRPVLEDEPIEALARLLAAVHGDADASAPTEEGVAQAQRVVARGAATFRAYGYGL